MGIPPLLEILKGGDRRSIGRADAVVEMVLSDRWRVGELVSAMRSEDRVVRMRAADASEKIGRTQAAWFEPHKIDLLRLAMTEDQQEVKWHLALLIPRLSLREPEAASFARLLQQWTQDQSRIVRVSALQGLADLAAEHPGLQPSLDDLLDQFAGDSAPSVRARVRQLAKKLRPR